MSDIFDDIKNWNFFGKRESRILIIENPKNRKRSLDQKIRNTRKIEKTASTDISVELNVLFSRYSKKLFEKHVLVSKSINLGIWKSIENVPEELKELVDDLKKSEIFYNKDLSYALKKYPNLEVNYKDFKENSINILSKYIQYLLENDYYELLLKNKRLPKRLNDKRRIKRSDADFTIIIQMIDGFKEGCIAVYDGTNSRITGFNLELSGALVVGRLYLPYTYTKKIDAQYIEKTLVHEFQHRMQDMNGIIKKEEDTKRVLAQKLGLNPDDWEGWVSNTYTAILGLFSEGVATFVERKWSDKIIFDLDEIEKLISLLVKMSKEPDEDKEADIFDNQFSESSRTGEYYLGFLMCYFIGLSIYSKRNEGKIFLSIKLNKKDDVSLYQKQALNDYLLKKRKIILSPLDPETLRLTHLELSNLGKYQDFIRRYEEACNYLQLKEPIKFMSNNFIDNLKQNFRNKNKQ